MQTKCPYCNGTGLKDSGGETPWGDEILIPCICTADEIDNLNFKCKKCKKGVYKETSVMDDIQGVLHCSVCGVEIKRHLTKRAPDVAKSGKNNRSISGKRPAKSPRR
jgi:hypothetical protein